MNVNISDFASRFKLLFPANLNKAPWWISQNIQQILNEKIGSLTDDYRIENNVAVHRTAIIEQDVILKGPIIISPNCFIGAHAYFRGGVFLDDNVSVGPGCEIKSSMILSNSALAHFNFVGDSLLGSYVNMEAGSIIANHYNEREQKTIFVRIDGTCTAIDSIKFGALVGDYTKIGANAVLSPGTLLQPRSVVKRLELIEQC